MNNILLTTRGWAKSEEQGCTVQAKGYGFRDARLLKGDDLAAHVAQQMRQGIPFEAILKKLKGHFALVGEVDDKVYFGADTVRSYPLLYRTDNNSIADAIASLVSEEDTMDMDSMAEFSCAGYVTGQNTMYAGIKSLQGGEYGVVTSDGIVVHRYKTYTCTYSNDDEESLCRALDTVIENIFARSIEWCDGRQVIVPLSAGLDSRLIVTALKRFGYENVLCVAYGLPDNFEAVKSRQVAEELGYEWLQVEYKPEEMRRVFRSEEMYTYMEYAHNGVSFPFMDDWMMTRELKNRKLISEDAVFMPGHTGDFIVGSHLKYLLDPEFHDDAEDVEGAIIGKHFSLWTDLISRPAIRQAILERIRGQYTQWPMQNTEQRAAVYESWECSERQFKYCVNGARVFEYFGYDWCLPLWDDDMVEFWEKVSIGLKMDSYLYRKYLATYDLFGLFQSDLRDERWDREAAIRARQEKLSCSKSRRLEDFLKNIRVLDAVFKTKRLHRSHRKFYEKHASGFPKLYGYWRYTWRELPKRHHISLFLNDVIKELYGASGHKLLARLD